MPCAVPIVNYSCRRAQAEPLLSLTDNNNNNNKKALPGKLLFLYTKQISLVDSFHNIQQATDMFSSLTPLDPSVPSGHTIRLQATAVLHKHYD